MSLAKLMNNYFINITNDLELKLDVLTNTNVDLPSIIENYKNHLQVYVPQNTTVPQNTGFGILNIIFAPNDLRS